MAGPDARQRDGDSEGQPGGALTDRPSRASGGGGNTTVVPRPHDAAPDPEFSLVDGDVPFRLQRSVGLIPARGLGCGRRALAAVLVTWVPIAIAAASAGRLMPGNVEEPLHLLDALKIVMSTLL